jgi:hypothetical protein
MEPRKLTIRRFGPMSFGIGYLEDGVWIDHSTVPDTAADGEDAMALLHAWYGCCADATRLELTVGLDQAKVGT